MPLTSVPPIGGGIPKMLGVFPRLTPISINVVGTNILYLAETSIQLTSTTDDLVIDALPVSQQNGFVVFWAIGEVWVAGSQAVGNVFKPFIYIPGVVTSGGVIVTGHGGYGTSPSVPPTWDGLYGDLNSPNQGWLPW